MKHIFMTDNAIFDDIAVSADGIDIEKIWSTYGGKIFYAAVILALGFFFIKFFTEKIKKILKNAGVEIPSTRIVDLLMKFALYFAVILMAASVLGIPTGSVLALFSVLALSFSLAIKDALALLASGMIIVISKPFVIGDLIGIPSDEVEGVVSQIGLIHTRLISINGREIVIPNSVITANTIINYTKQKFRRIDAVFSVFYGQDIEKAKAAVLNAVSDDDDFEKEPKPFIGVKTLNASSVDIICRVFVKWDRYEELLCRINEDVYKMFVKEGIEIPYNQLDVHIK